MEKRSQKLYLTDCNLLTIQDLWQDYYQILSIILLKDFINLSVQILGSAVLNIQTLKMGY